MVDLKSRTKLNNGSRMPWLGFGVFQTPPGEVTRQSVLTALQAGYRSVDTATIYRNESDVGEALRETDVPREEIFVTTKVWNDDQGYESTLKAFAESKRRLDLDVVDLYLVHWPVTGKSEATYRAMETLLQDGEVRAIGVSNFLVHHLQDLLENSDVVPAVNQIEYHPFLVQPELLEFCREHNIQVEAWSPLTRGRYLNNPVIAEIAERYQKTPAQVMLRWDLQHLVVTIPRSTKESHILENTRIFDFQISREDMEKLDALDRGERVGPHPDRFGS